MTKQERSTFAGIFIKEAFDVLYGVHPHQQSPAKTPSVQAPDGERRPESSVIWKVL